MKLTFAILVLILCFVIEEIYGQAPCSSITNYTQCYGRVDCKACGTQSHCDNNTFRICIDSNDTCSSHNNAYVKCDNTSSVSYPQSSMIITVNSTSTSNSQVSPTKTGSASSFIISFNWIWGTVCALAVVLYA